MALLGLRDTYSSHFTTNIITVGLAAVARAKQPQIQLIKQDSISITHVCKLFNYMLPNLFSCVREFLKCHEDPDDLTHNIAIISMPAKPPTALQTALD